MTLGDCRGKAAAPPACPFNGTVHVDMARILCFWGVLCPNIMRLYPLHGEVRSRSHHAKSGLRHEQAKCCTRALQIPGIRSDHPYIRETNSSAMISKLVAAISRHILDGDDLIAL